MNIYAVHYFVMNRKGVVKIFAIVTANDEMSAITAAPAFEQSPVEHCRACLMGIALPNSINGAYLCRLER